MSEPYKVLIVDDSVLVQKYLSRILESDPELTVVACADDPYQARDYISEFNPDVLTLDVEMPKMDGITFLQKLMRIRPLPVVMCSSLTEKNSGVTLTALQSGAVDYILKPELNNNDDLAEYSKLIIEKVKNAAKCNVRAIRNDKPTPLIIPKKSAEKTSFTRDTIIAIGSSTGGVEALNVILQSMPLDSPPIVITQHIPHNFALQLAERLNELMELSVTVPTEPCQLLTGHIYISPGDKHLITCKRGNKYFCDFDIKNGAVNGHIPSVDVLFNSVATNFGTRAVAAVLTGMGGDGAEGMLAIKNAGGLTLAQDELTSVVWGMPKKAYEIGATDELVALDKIAKNILDKLSTIGDK